MITTAVFNFLTDNELEARINEYNNANVQHDTNWSVKHINTFLWPENGRMDKNTRYDTRHTLILERD